MKAWTDYPIEALGDRENEIAPVRRCKILDWDRDKYCHIEVGGAKELVKRGYLYRREGRYGEVPGIWKWRLWLVPRTRWS